MNNPDNEADKNDYDTCPYCGIIGVLEGHRCKPRADKDTLVAQLEDWYNSPNDLYSKQKAKLRKAIIKIESLTAQNDELKKCMTTPRIEDLEKIDALTAQNRKLKNGIRTITPANLRDPLKHIAELESQIAALTATLDVYIENNNKLNAQNEEYDRALELLSSGWAYVHDMHGFAKTQRKRISELQEQDDG